MKNADDAVYGDQCRCIRSASPLLAARKNGNQTEQDQKDGEGISEDA